MSIICGTDFSAPAAEAARAAAAVAQAWGESLRLVHVVDPFDDDSAAPSATQALIDRRTAELGVLAASLRATTGAKIDFEVRRGIVDVELTRLAAETQARLLVVAALGQRREPRWLVGSVAERIARATSVPALLVRDAASLVEWAGGQRKLRVLAAIDQGESSRLALRWAAALSAPGGSDLIVAQMVSPPAEHARLGLPGPVSLDRIEPEIEQRLEAEFRKWAADVPGAARARLVLAPAWGRVDANLAMLGSIEGATAIVVGSHRRNALARAVLGSVSGGVVHRADTNVFVIPVTLEGAAPEGAVEFRNVLVPTDFSPQAVSAVRHALGLLQAGGTLHLLHVLDPGRSPAFDRLDSTLSAAIPPDAAGRRIRVTTELTTADSIAAGILQAAERQDADVICMGTHGRAGIVKALLGSQAEAVLRASRIPVLLVPSPRD